MQSSFSNLGLLATFLICQNAVAYERPELTESRFIKKLAALEKRYCDSELQSGLDVALSDPGRFCKAEYAWHVGATHTPQSWYLFHDALLAVAQHDWTLCNSKLDAAEKEDDSSSPQITARVPESRKFDLLIVRALMDKERHHYRDCLENLHALYEFRKANPSLANDQHSEILFSFKIRKDLFSLPMY